jgi:hypothetical protein
LAYLSIDYQCLGQPFYFLKSNKNFNSMYDFKQNAAQKLYSFAMNCGQSLRFLFALVILALVTQQDISAQTMSMYDVPVGSNFKPKREIVIHKRVRFVFELGVIDIRPDLSFPIQPVIGNAFNFTYPTSGIKNITVRHIGPQAQVLTKTFSITIKEPKQGVTYKSPDDIWTITTSQNFTPACEGAAYPNGAPLLTTSLLAISMASFGKPISRLRGQLLLGRQGKFGCFLTPTHRLAIFGYKPTGIHLVKKNR